ncbi:YiiX/YebB-like N1pC/P60 family cysteine hydrolase [Planctomicrobium sp. SH664]|uniref:YiiX/YebB-like N1pC/P60 family cysteine hydrolase n=1 Tax=Planctomicrobium sp. SH664 TaxID=3448125 RepID=UPI003F5BC7B6
MTRSLLFLMLWAATPVWGSESGSSATMPTSLRETESAAPFVFDSRRLLPAIVKLSGAADREIAPSRQFASLNSPVPVPDAKVVPASFDEAVDCIRAQCQTGSLIFTEGDCLAVRIFTWSSYTHVGAVVFEGDEPFVYDSTSGIGVRKLPLREFLLALQVEQVSLLHPVRPFTAEEAATFELTLRGELGRPYSVKHHLTGRRNSGLHCAEYVTDALISIDWLQAKNPVRVSPASLVAGIVMYQVYQVGEIVPVPVVLTPVPETTGMCARLWQGTRSALASCTTKLSGWVLCR